MARPITWQDVAAPNLGGSLLASQNAAEMVGKALTGLGDVGTQYMADTKEAATRDAVADIMNSADPLAAARAAPQGWQVDPLAVQQAAQAQDHVMRQNLASDASLASTKLNTELTQEQLNDRVAVRQGEDMALPYRADIFSGKAINIDRTDPRYRTAAGKAALDRIDSWTKEYNDQFDRNLARQDRAKLVAENKAQQAAQDQAAKFMASPAGTGATQVEIDREMNRIAEATGAGSRFAPSLIATFGTDANRGKVSTAELYQKSPEGIQYQAPITALNTQNSVLETERNSQLSQLAVATEGVAAMEANPYKKMSPGAINAAVLKNHKGVTEGWGPDWTEKDVQQRRDYQFELANKDVAGIARQLGREVPKGFVPLTPAQEANLVELTIGNNTFGDSTTSDAADALRKSYIQYNLYGGTAEIAKKNAEITDQFQRQIDKNNQIIRRTQATARTGEAIPKEALTVYDLTPERQAEIAAAKEKADAAKVTAKINEINARTKDTAEKAKEFLKWDFAPNALKLLGK